MRDLRVRNSNSENLEDRTPKSVECAPTVVLCATGKYNDQGISDQHKR